MLLRGFRSKLVLLKEHHTASMQPCYHYSPCSTLPVSIPLKGSFVQLCKRNPPTETQLPGGLLSRELSDAAVPRSPASCFGVPVEGAAAGGVMDLEGFGSC